MPCVGLTQRVDVASTGERRDALDQQWTPFLEQLGWTVHPLPNRAVPDGDDDASFDRWFRHRPLDAAVLSGGGTPDVPGVPSNEITPERDRLERFLLTHLPRRGRPVLGVCRGFQAVVCFFGGRFRRVPGHVAVRHALNAPTLPPAPGDVNSYHNYAVFSDDLPAVLAPVAFAPDGTVEAVRHTTLPVFAVMWHPEREAPFRETDQTLFRQWLIAPESAP